MKKIIALAIIAVALVGCGVTGIPAGGISDQASGKAVTVEAKNTNILAFTPMKNEQMKELIKDAGKQCAGGEFVNGLFWRDDLNLGVISFEKAVLSGQCK
ncbi:MAG: hypothetical protein FWC15_01090 [Fibromonadales bacterium]|nr:hypothetical protein [Fibromonadales bacterium]